MKKTSARSTGAAMAVVGTSYLYANADNNSNKPVLVGGSLVSTKSFEQPRPIFDDNEEKALLKALVNSQAFRKSFSQAHLKKYRDSLQLPIIDNIRPGGKEKLSIEGKIAFLESKKDIDDIVEAFERLHRTLTN
jgi:hypothetical protein